MNQTDALTILRAAVAKFDRSEKLALAALLVCQCNPRFRQVTHEANPPFGGGLDTALVAVEAGNFPQTVKLAFAIEILQRQLSLDEEADNRTEVGDYDGGLDPYGYHTLAIDEEEEEY